MTCQIRSGCTMELVRLGLDFYINDRDFKSKRTFGILMIMFSLTETGAKEAMPLITIPAG